MSWTSLATSARPGGGAARRSRWAAALVVDLRRAAGSGDLDAPADVVHQELALEPHGVTCSAALAAAALASPDRGRADVAHVPQH